MKANAIALGLCCLPLAALAEPQSAAQVSGTSYRLYVGNPDLAAYSCRYEVTLSYAQGGMPQTKRYSGDFILTPQQPPTAVMDLHSNFANLTEVKPPDVHCMATTAGGSAPPPSMPMAPPTSESAPMTVPPSPSGMPYAPAMGPATMPGTLPPAAPMPPGMPDGQ